MIVIEGLEWTGATTTAHRQRAKRHLVTQLLIPDIPGTS